jgi:hypothetical protein
VDTEQLPPEEAARVEALVKASNLPEAAQRAAARTRAPRPDEMYHEIRVEDHGVTHSVSLSGHGMPAELQSLVAWLTTCSAGGR